MNLEIPLKETIRDSFSRGQSISHSSLTRVCSKVAHRHLDIGHVIATSPRGGEGYMFQWSWAFKTDAPCFTAPSANRNAVQGPCGGSPRLASALFLPRPLEKNNATTPIIELGFWAASFG